MVADDRYEWTHIPCDKADKTIYIRDIYKSWYVTGINDRISNMNQLILFLKRETDGYETVTIGSSSGGYLAALLSYYLHAAYSIVFSAQFELNNKWAINANPFLQKMKNNPEAAQYYDLKPILMQSTTPIFYIVPFKCEQDYYHWNYIRDVPCVRSIRFSSRHHGVVLLKNNLNRLINMDYEELEALFSKKANRLQSPILFSCEFVGAKRTIKELSHVTKNLIKRKFMKR